MLKLLNDIYIRLKRQCNACIACIHAIHAILAIHRNYYRIVTPLSDIFLSLMIVTISFIEHP